MNYYDNNNYLEFVVYIHEGEKEGTREPEITSIQGCSQLNPNQLHKFLGCWDLCLKEGLDKLPLERFYLFRIKWIDWGVTQYTIEKCEDVTDHPTEAYRIH